MLITVSQSQAENNRTASYSKNTSEILTINTKQTLQFKIEKNLDLVFLDLPCKGHNFIIIT